MRSEDFDAATKAALHHTDGQVVAAVTDGRLTNTRKSYAQDWASWTKFFSDSGPLSPSAPGRW